VRRIILIMLAMVLLFSLASAERFEYSADINLEIPDFDSLGITDTIFIPDHIIIEDINFYVGIGVPSTPWAEHVWVDVYSPNSTQVRLNDWGGVRIHWYLVWYDTEREVDGPGHLSDYNGSDSYGLWTMHAFDMFPDYTLHWYTWRIEVYCDLITSLDEEDIDLPEDFVLESIYPNPFNATTTIDFGLPESSPVIIEIYDILGRKVNTLIDCEYQPGYHSVSWDGDDGNRNPVSSGVYIFRMSAGDRILIKRAVLLK
jgi:subtilisin-like proprotein convertase family protein